VAAVARASAFSSPRFCRGTLSELAGYGVGCFNCWPGSYSKQPLTDTWPAFLRCQLGRKYAQKKSR
jgi:hypothetical protein